MNRKLSIAAVLLFLALLLCSACGNSPDKSNSDVETSAPIEDGVYSVDFNTDSTMFHINEALNGKATLTVEDGIMNVHIILPSTSIQHLYIGMASEAENDEANWLNPIVETVTYSDGATDEANAFDITVPYLDEEFDVALIGSKGVWYDHKVSVSNPVLGDEVSDMEMDLADGTYEADVTLSGGSGKATVESPAEIVIEDGQCVAKITWSSPHYDYMIVNGVKYLPVNTEGNSTFEIPVKAFDEEISVIADTTAMSQPHEIEYTLNFSSATLK